MAPSVPKCNPALFKQTNTAHCFKIPYKIAYCSICKVLMVYIDLDEKYLKLILIFADYKLTLGNMAVRK